MKKKILIVGSNGFIGSALAKRLASAGYLVEGVGRSDNKNKSELSDYHIYKDSNEFLDELFLSGFDACVNCAGLAKVSDSFKFPKVDFNLNVQLVFNILNAIKQSSPQTFFVNLSSAAVYGNPQSLPISEEQATNPISPYGFHKQMSETIINSFHQNFGIQGLSLRIFSAYGQGLKKQLFWDLLNKSINQNELILFGDGNESRDFVEINDLTTLLQLILKHKPKELILNAANGKEWKIKEVVSIFVNQFH